MKKRNISILLILGLFLTGILPIATMAVTAPGSATTFSDVLASHPDYTAIEYLKNEGIINGYPDGTFKPEQVVNRAEALKIILGANKTAIQEASKSSFTDVTAADWFFKYIETAKALNIVSGNPDGSFAPARTVNKVEFLKMLLLAYDVKFVNYKPPVKPLYPDVTDNSAWYIQYLDFAKNLNLISPNSAGEIQPDQGLTRGEVAEISYKLIIIIKGGPVQLLLSRAEAQLMQSIFDLRDGALSDAANDIKTAKDLASEALKQAPDQSIVQAAVKIIEAFEALVTAFQQTANGQNTDALKSAGLAYNTAEAARQINSGIDNLATQVKNAAKSLADSIRAKQ